MRLFLDTEFSDLVHPQLLSLALVAEDGRELYVEIANVVSTDCSEFVRSAVLPMLAPNLQRLAESDAAERVKGFLSQFAKVTVLTDAPHYDAALMLELLREMPPNLRCERLAFDDARERHEFNLALESVYQRESLRRHHALDDARALRLAWQAVRAV